MGCDDRYGEPDPEYTERMDEVYNLRKQLLELPAGHFSVAELSFLIGAHPKYGFGIGHLPQLRELAKKLL